MTETPAYSLESVPPEIQEAFANMASYLSTVGIINATEAMKNCLVNTGFVRNANSNPMDTFASLIIDVEGDNKLRDAGKILVQDVRLRETSTSEKKYPPLIHQVITATMALGFMLRFFDQNADRRWVNPNPTDNLHEEELHGKISNTLIEGIIKKEDIDSALDTLTKDARSIDMFVIGIVRKTTKSNHIPQEETDALIETCQKVCALVYTNLEGWSGPEGAFPYAKPGEPGPGGLRAEAALPTRR